jgi:hypothetical protein
VSDLDRDIEIAAASASSGSAVTSTDLGPFILRSPELCEAVGITYRQLDYWCRLGLLESTRPPVKKNPKHRKCSAPTSGSPRLFLVSELAVARVLRALYVQLQARPGANAALLDLIARVRAGERGIVEYEPGILLDLDTICA